MNVLLMTLLTFSLYYIAKQLSLRSPFILFQPLVFTPVLIIIILLVFNVSSEDYREGTSMLTYMLQPATVAFAIPIYKHLDALKKHIRIILLAVSVGVVVAILSTLVMSLLFGIEHDFLISLLPRSITTPLALEVSSLIGGVPSLSIVFVIITGILGALVGPYIFRLLNIKTSIAKGLALGMGAHAVGTNRALSYGDEETTYSTLAMILAGILTILISITLLPFLLDFLYIYEII